MAKIVIQAGHINGKNNIDAGIRKSTGAPGEQELTQRVSDRVSAMCRERGIEVVQTDANANSDPNITKKDFDLFLALHGDADAPGDKGGGMIGSGDPSVDLSWQKSKQIADAIDSVYFNEVGIVDKKYVTTGMPKYYMWKYLSPKTPCVLLEMGQVQDPHDKVLLGNTALIATGIVKGICKALNVNYEINQSTPSNTITPEKQIEQLNKTIEELKKAIGQEKLNTETKLAAKDADCQQKITSYKEKIINFINLI